MPKIPVVSGTSYPVRRGSPCVGKEVTVLKGRPSSRQFKAHGTGHASKLISHSYQNASFPTRLPIP